MEMKSISDMKQQLRYLYLTSLTSQHVLLAWTFVELIHLTSKSIMLAVKEHLYQPASSILIQYIQYVII